MNYKIPRLAGEYVHVYSPAPDVFQGPDSKLFKAGERYEDWVPNDFSVVRGKDGWHLIGITHPRPPQFVHALDRCPDIHDAEWQLFHAFCRCETLKEALHPGAFADCGQVLPAPQRPAERPEIWAPIVWPCSEGYVMIYSPDPFRRAVSTDLTHWTSEGDVLHLDDNAARDPNIFEDEDGYVLVFLKSDGLYISRSADLKHFDEPVCLFKNRGSYSMESPVLKKIDGWYYLFYCIYDDNDRINGSYDYRTYVYAARTLDKLGESPCIAQLNVHAPELFQDETGAWFIASVEWPHRGVSIAPIEWVQPD